MELTQDFFNKVCKDIDKKYFPSVKYYRDNKNCTKVHYAVELFNNGMITYTNLILKLSKACKATELDLHYIVMSYVKKFDFKYKPVNF